MRPSCFPLMRLDSIMEIIDTFFEAICMGEHAEKQENMNLALHGDSCFCYCIYESIYTQRHRILKLLFFL
jgi:hypothetical protein